MQEFCIAMDNYFTLPNVIKKLRELGFGIVGTARARQNWPPKNCKRLNKNKQASMIFFTASMKWELSVKNGWTMDSYSAFRLFTQLVVLFSDQGGAR